MSHLLVSSDFPNRDAQATCQAPTVAAAESERAVGAVYIVDPRRGDYPGCSSGLERSHVDLRFFATAGAVLRATLREAPLFYLVNTRLPDMSGFELREMLGEVWRGIPGCLISDRYDVEDEVKARCSGSTLYLCKPLRDGWLDSALGPRLPTARLARTAAVTDVADRTTRRQNPSPIPRET